MYIMEKYFDGDVGYQHAGWETSACPLTNASENLAGRVENKPRQVKFCIGYIRDCPVRGNAKKFKLSSLNMTKAVKILPWPGTPLQVQNCIFNHYKTCNYILAMLLTCDNFGGILLYFLWVFIQKIFF